MEDVVRRLLLTGATTLVVVGCGRSAPVDALNDIGSDPDIAGVSVTSPDAVVATEPPAEGETTTTASGAAAQEVLYTVAPGDTLSGIASAYGVTVQQLADYNGIEDVHAISPGQQLAIPPAPVEIEVEQPAEEEPSE